MKRLVIALLPVLCCLTAWAQPEFETWGKLTKEERNLKVCSFDPEADAVVLLDEAVSDHDDERHLLTYRHIRIKILKDKGLPWADVAIVYYARDDFETIDDIEGNAYNFDASGNMAMVGLDRKSIFTEKSTLAHHRKKFTFPGIKAGSIIEYKYKSTMKSYSGLEDWQFQQELPVVTSKYNLAILPNYEFAYMVHKSDQIPIIVKPDNTNGKIYFEMNNVPGLRDEPYMDARNDYIQRVVFQLSMYDTGGFGRKKYMTSWDEVTREMLTSPSFGSQIGKSVNGTDDFINEIKLLSSPLEKMKRVYHYVHNYMGWNNYIGVYTMEGVKTAWSKKSGSITDVNMVLLNLLKEAGLDAYPLLVSTRDHGKVSTQYPFVDQFSGMYALVVIGDKKYYLNAVDPNAQPEMVPLSILNTTGFIVSRKNGGILQITDEALQYKESMTTSLQISAANTITGVSYTNSQHYARTQRLSSWKRNGQRYIDGLRKDGSSIVIDSFNLKNQDTDSLPLQQYVRFKGPATVTGDYIFVPVNLLSGFETNPFIATNRFSDINFGFRRDVSFSTYIDIPEGYAPDVLPKSVQLVNADKTVFFIREIFNDAATNKILARIRIELRKSLYGAEEYEELKEFYKKMFDMLNEQIVFKKK
jgi:hypothetical protein